MKIRGLSHKAKTRIGNHGNIWEDGYPKDINSKNTIHHVDKILLRSTQDGYLAWFLLSEIIIEKD